MLVVHEKELATGSEVEVYRDFYTAFYKGTITQYDALESLATVVYDDGDIEELLMNKELWRFPSQNVCT